MRNPFESESSAFRFVLVTLVALAVLAAVGALVGLVAAIVAWALLSGAVAGFYLFGARRTRGLRSAPPHVGPPQERRLLVLAQEPLPAEVVPRLRTQADRVLVVSAPAVPPLQRWVSDLDEAREQARRRVEEAVAGLRAAQTEAEGLVGDDDPVQALEDALRTFGGDAIVVSAGGAPGEALARRVRDRYALPVSRVGA